MTGWTITTAATDAPEQFQNYMTDECGATADRIATGTVEDGHAYVILSGGYLVDVVLEAVEECSVDCNWIALVADNDTDPNETLWIYTPLDPRSPSPSPDTEYVCVDTYNHRIGEYFLSDESWENGQTVTTAYEYARDVYDIQIRTRPYGDGGVEFRADAVDTDPEIV